MKQFDFIDLAAQGGFELIETTSERSGYPLDLKRLLSALSLWKKHVNMQSSTI